MYIIKNALRCIGRSKGRNVLIGIIALVIAVSACLGLSIRQAAESAKESMLEGMSVTGTISYDRSSVMGNLGGTRPGGTRPNGSGSFEGFDREEFENIMGSASSLTLEEYQLYATAESVQDFYYTLTAYFNGSDSFSPVSNESSSENDDDTTSSDSSRPDNFGGMMGGMMGGMFGGMGASGDFSIIGYSGDNAMTDFINGTASMVDDGSSVMFEEGTSEYVCVISKELAIYNNLAVGDTIVITNPSLESETYTLTISGIYTSSTTNSGFSSMFSGGQDPANRIYMSATALQSILDASAENSQTVTNETTGRESDSAIDSTLEATYVFADTDAYYAFEDEARALGLSDSYSISSTDITAFENSLTPLKTLSTMAGWFLLVILVIGGVILVVLNIFNVRERKYEVGVLTAMGMKKWKVAAQFMCEILVITMVAVLIGAGVGAVCSVPVTNALLESQLVSQQNQQSQVENNFGRPGNMGGGMMGGMPPSDMPSNMPSDMPNFGGGMGDFFGSVVSGANNYITEVNSAMNLTVVLQMIGVGLLLTLVASAASVLFIMRYDPLKILANRD